MVKDLQKAEALKRMKKLELHQNVIKEFEQEGKLNISEKGVLFWLNEEQKKYVHEFEKESDNLVFHIIHSFTEFGELYTMLYVSKHQEEWERDIEDIDNDICCAYVKNISDDWCSEYGYIGFKKFIGGLVRVA